MILVHSSKIVDTGSHNYHTIAHCEPLIGFYEDPPIFEQLEVTQEMVKGRRFVNVNGEHVVIGWDKATQVALGLPFEVFEDHNRQLVFFEKELKSCLRKLIMEQNISIIQFIKRRIKKWWISYYHKR